MGFLPQSPTVALYLYADTIPRYNINMQQALLHKSNAADDNLLVIGQVCRCKDESFKCCECVWVGLLSVCVMWVDSLAL